MKMNISKREKILLFAVALLVILYLSIQFAIIPLATRYFDGLDQRSYLAQEKYEADDKLHNSQIIQMENEDAQKRFEDIKQEYPLLVPNEEIDTLLTNLCLKHYLRPTSLRISLPPEPTPPAEGEEPAEETPEALFTVVTATMLVTGKYESLSSLLDEVDTKQFIRITKLGYTASRPEDPPETSRINIVFELTYVNPE